MSKFFPSSDGVEDSHLQNIPIKTLLIAPMLRNYLVVVFSGGVALGVGISHGMSSVVVRSDQQLITQDRYELVELEMSLMQVQMILGSGAEVSQSKSVTVFEWKNPDSSSITMSFKDGYLVKKEQENLI